MKNQERRTSIYLFYSKEKIEIDYQISLNVTEYANVKYPQEFDFLNRTNDEWISNLFITIDVAQGHSFTHYRLYADVGLKSYHLTWEKGGCFFAAQALAPGYPVVIEISADRHWVKIYHVEGFSTFTDLEYLFNNDFEQVLQPSMEAAKKQLKFNIASGLVNTALFQPII